MEAPTKPPDDSTHTIDTDLGTSSPGFDQARRLPTIPLDDLSEDALLTSPDKDFSVSPFLGRDSSIHSALSGIPLTDADMSYDPNPPPGKDLQEENINSDLTDPVADPTLNTTADGESAAPQIIEDIK